MIDIEIINNVVEINPQLSTVIDVQPQGITSIELIANPVAIKGINGKSAYEIALDNGFVGTEEDWLKSLQTDTLQWNSTNW